MILRTPLLLFMAIILCASAQVRTQAWAQQQEQATKLKIVVSVAPQKYLVEQIAGELATVNVMIDPGQTPATWEASPHKMIQLASTDILFCIGVPFEKVWLKKLKNSFPNLKIIDPRQDIELLSLNDHAHSSTTLPQEIVDIDPHIWLDPLRDIQMAKNITIALCQLDPTNQQRYKLGFKKLSAHLSKLNQQLTIMLAPYRGQQFMVFHPSWGYFAQRYHLQQLPIELSGKEPRGAKLAQIITTAREKNICTIFVQQQFSKKAAATIATQIGANIIVLDPLAENIPHTLFTTAQQLKTVMEATCQPSSH